MRTILAIDWGSKYMGLAQGNDVARIATPKGRIAAGSDVVSRLQEMVEAEQIAAVVVGLPRNLAGEETAQSAEIRLFADRLQQALQCPVVLQDETLSTQIGAQLAAQYPAADKDSLAAAVFLQDYLQTL